MNQDPSRHVGGVRLKTPVMAASGTFGYGTEVPLLDRSRLGGMVSKGIFLKPRPGTPPPRIVETPSGMLNVIGLQGPGVEAVVRDYAPVWSTWSAKIGSRVKRFIAKSEKTATFSRRVPTTGSWRA